MTSPPMPDGPIDASATSGLSWTRSFAETSAYPGWQWHHFDLVHAPTKAHIEQDTQAEETNRRLYLVSMVTAPALPVTFVTGFFGMNTGGLIWSGDGATAHGTLYALGLCILALFGMPGLLRWKKLL